MEYLVKQESYPPISKEELLELWRKQLVQPFKAQVNNLLLYIMYKMIVEFVS